MSRCFSWPPPKTISYRPPSAGATASTTATRRASRNSSNFPIGAISSAGARAGRISPAACSAGWSTTRRWAPRPAPNGAGSAPSVAAHRQAGNPGGGALDDLDVLDAGKAGEAGGDPTAVGGLQRDAALPADEVGPLEAELLLVQGAGEDQLLEPLRRVAGGPDLGGLAARD